MVAFIIFYFIGFILCFSYLSFRLYHSVLRVELIPRFLHIFMFSIFWFILVPYSICNGEFFVDQLEYDREFYEEMVDQQIDDAIEKMRSAGTLKDEGKSREELRKSIGTFDDVLEELDEV